MSLIFIDFGEFSCICVYLYQAHSTLRITILKKQVISRISSRRLWVFFVFILPLGLVVILEARPNFNDLSESQLAQAGYYTYVLSSDRQSEMNWTRKISMKSFNYQCVTDMDSRDDHWNFVRVVYFDSQDAVFEVRISPDDALFDKRKAQSITVKNHIGVSQIGFYYEGENTREFLFTDTTGMDVTITSVLPMDQTIHLIGELISTKRTGTANPWVENCR